METILSACAIGIALATLLGVLVLQRRRIRRLSGQVDALSLQAEMLRTNMLDPQAEVVQAQFEFYLPAKKQRSIAVFESIQQDDAETVLGQQASIDQRWESELHVRFSADASVRLRQIRWGFPDSLNGTDYADHPTIVDYRTPFAVDTRDQSPRDVYRDWDGFWHIEFPMARLLPTNTFYPLCFTVKADHSGRFPVVFEIISDDARDPFEDILWVKVTD